VPFGSVSVSPVIGSIGTIILGIAIYGDPVNVGGDVFLSVLIFLLVGFKIYLG